jgi:hypothetical protein
MTKKVALLVLFTTAFVLALACDDTSGPCGCPPVVRPVLKDLSQRNHVLDNIEAAYNYRRIDWYNGLLDQDFTFFLSTGDVNGGLPASWNRAEEVDINTKLFDTSYTALPAQNIFLDIRSEDGVSWMEFHPQSAPSETWYSTTLHYDYRFEISPNTYIPAPGAQAVFTVRDAGVYGKYAHHWQLVEFSDLGGSAAVKASASAARTEPSTLGAVKAMYR